MIRDPSDLTTLMTSGSDPEEVIARRAVFHLSIEWPVWDTFLFCEQNEPRI